MHTEYCRTRSYLYFGRMTVFGPLLYIFLPTARAMKTVFDDQLLPNIKCRFQHGRLDVSIFKHRCIGSSANCIIGHAIGHRSATRRRRVLVTCVFLLIYPIFYRTFQLAPQKNDVTFFRSIGGSIGQDELPENRRSVA